MTPLKKTSTTKKKTTTSGISNVPTNLQIGPYNFTIEVVEDLTASHNTREATAGDSLYGLTSLDKQLIQLDSEMQGVVVKETLLHEILHAIWEVVGGYQGGKFKISEEQIVRMISPTLLDTFRRNPDLVEYLFGE